MTFRDAIDAVLAGMDVGMDPATVLAEHGFADLPPEAFSSGLLHFAERAPLDVADALAPIVTRISPVPFEPGDLPESPADDLLDQGGDVFSLLTEVGLAELDPSAEADPSGFDDDLDSSDPGDTTTDADGHGPVHDVDSGLDHDAELRPVSADGSEARDLDHDDADDGDGEDDGDTFGHGEGHLSDLDDLGDSDPFDDVDLEPQEAFVDGQDDNDVWGREDGQAAESIAESLIDIAQHVEHDLDAQLHGDHDPAHFDTDLD